MTFEDVEKNIEGSILKGLYLEAFLLQSAYIEGLLKNFAEFETWRAISYRRELEGNVEKIVNSLRTDVTRFGFRKLIDFVHESGFLEDKDKSALHKYREIRNNIVHSLPTKISEKDFDVQLEKACAKGKEIMGTKVIQDISKLNKDYEAKHRN